MVATVGDVKTDEDQIVHMATGELYNKSRCYAVGVVNYSAITRTARQIFS